MLSVFSKPDIPFNRDDANRFMPWIVGLMVCLVGLFLALTISIATASKGPSLLNINHFQVYVPYQGDGMERQVGLVTTALQTIASVTGVKKISQDEIQSMIEPWTGKLVSLDDIPLPAVLEGTLKEGVNRAEQIRTIKAKLSRIDEKIEVEHYEEWISQLWRFTDALSVLSLSLSVLLVLGLVAMVILASRTSMKLHFSTVSVLHHIGAEDHYIVKQFAANGVWMVFRGAIVGAAIAILIAVVLAMLSDKLQSPLLPEFRVHALHAMMFIGLPVFSALVAYITIRVTVYGMLRHMT